MLLQGFETESGGPPSTVTAMRFLSATTPDLSFNMICIGLNFKGKGCIALF
jgi:hypothetical protein